jgi:hypothetical protein
MGFATFSEEMTAAEALADYNNITEWAGGGDGLGQRIGEIPWLWTKDGDDVVDNCDDDNQDNWAVVSGIAGSVPAYTLWEIAANTSSNAYWLLKSLQPQNNFLRPTSSSEGQYYKDYDGTAEADTTSNDEYWADLDVGGDITAMTCIINNPELFVGRTHCFIRIRRASGAETTQDVAPFYRYGNVAPDIWGDRKTLTNYDGTWRIHYLGSLNVVHPVGLEPSNKQLTIMIQAYDSTSDMDMDLLMVIPGDIMLISTDDCTGNSYLRIVDYNAYGMTAADLTYRVMNTYGRKIELEPNKLNMLWWITGGDAQAHVITRTATFNKVFITPRWNLL